MLKKFMVGFSPETVMDIEEQLVDILEEGKKYTLVANHQLEKGELILCLYDEDDTQKIRNFFKDLNS